MPYRYESPHCWLADKIRRIDDLAELKSMLTSIFEKIDPEDIQDVFQTDMDADGYFDLDE